MGAQQTSCVDTPRDAATASPAGAAAADTDSKSSSSNSTAASSLHSEPEYFLPGQGSRSVGSQASSSSRSTPLGAPSAATTEQISPDEASRPRSSFPEPGADKKSRERALRARFASLTPAQLDELRTTGAVHKRWRCHGRLTDVLLTFTHLRLKEVPTAVSQFRVCLRSPVGQEPSFEDLPPVCPETLHRISAESHNDALEGYTAEHNPYFPYDKIESKVEEHWKSTYGIKATAQESETRTASDR